MKKLSLLFLAMVSVFTLQAETFIKVTDPATLKDGDQVVLGYEAATKVSASFSSTKKFIATTDATFSDDNVTLTEPTTITLKKSGSYWNLYIDSKPVGHKSGSNDLDVDRKTTTNFAITIENGNAKLVSQTPGKNSNEVFFAYNASSPRFALYHAGSNKRIGNTVFDKAKGADKGLDPICLFRLRVIVFTQPGVKLGMEIAHDAAITVATTAHGLQQRLAIGIEQLELAAL